MITPSPRPTRFHPVLALVVAFGISMGCEPGSGLARESSSPPVGSRSDSPPSIRLVVVIVVDQMRADFLSRFAGQYEFGLRRFLDDGVVFEDAHQDHALTVTAPGSATVSTGRFPGHCGIAGNDFWDRKNGKSVYSVDDKSVQTVTRMRSPGRSPRNLECDTLGEWLKEASPKSKVFAVAIKDRAAILMGGHKADGAFWFESESCGFVTSSYYPRRLADWARDLHYDSAGYPGTWERLRPVEDYGLAREDAFASEADGVETTFPHAIGDGRPGSLDWCRDLRNTPYGDVWTFDFAETLATREKLGRDDTPDLLFVGASAADAVGHGFGPQSQEIQDYYLRLDREIGRFLRYLDERVGKGRYVLALTSDHGVMPMPEWLVREGVDAGRFHGADVRDLIEDILARAAAKLGLEALPRWKYVNGVAFEPSSATPEQMRILRKELAAGLRAHKRIADAYTADELRDPATADRPYLAAYRRSFHPERSADVMLRLQEHWILNSKSTGTTHGSPYAYDTLVPLVFLGPQFPSAHHPQRVRTVDLAPTLAELLGVKPPDDADGRSLGEFLASAP